MDSFLEPLRSFIARDYEQRTGNQLQDHHNSGNSNSTGGSGGAGGEDNNSSSSWNNGGEPSSPASGGGYFMGPPDGNNDLTLVRVLNVQIRGTDIKIRIPLTMKYFSVQNIHSFLVSFFRPVSYYATIFRLRIVSVLRGPCAS